MQVNDLPSKDRPPSYKASPTYTSVAHRKLPPTPNRNSPYGVINSDRRNMNSPSMYQRISDLAISEQSARDHRSESPYQRLPLSRQSPSQQDYRQSEMLYTQDVTRIPNLSENTSCATPSSQILVPSSANSKYPQHDHDSSQSSGFSSDTSKSRPYNPLPLKLNHMSGDRPPGERSGTPVFVNCEEERGDSPRESGYSSREHSSHRNSPCDTLLPQGQYTDQAEDFKNSGSSCEDIATYKHNLQMSQARVPRLLENSPRMYRSAKYSGKVLLSLISCLPVQCWIVPVVMFVIWEKKWPVLGFFWMKKLLHMISACFGLRKIIASLRNVLYYFSA